MIETHFQVPFKCSSVNIQITSSRLTRKQKNGQAKYYNLVIAELGRRDAGGSGCEVSLAAQQVQGHRHKLL